MRTPAVQLNSYQLLSKVHRFTFSAYKKVGLATYVPNHYEFSMPMDINDTTAIIDGGAIIDSSSKKTDKRDAGRFTFSQIHKYLLHGIYPNLFDKSDKQALTKRSKYFQIADGNLYYVGGGKHPVYI